MMEIEGDRTPRPSLLPEVGNDISPRLRDMVRLPAKSSELELSRLTRSQEKVTAQVTDSGVISVAGVLPETDGEVGATQRVKIVNRSYQIFDKSTGASVLGPSDISTIWAGFSGPCASGGAGAAVVLYDKVAERWVFSQFASANGGKTITEECFAVSTTSDATASYYRYVFKLGGNFVDSPHLSVRSDGYLMGDSVYDQSGTERVGTQFFLFDRAAMLLGGAATLTTPGVDTGVGETYSISAKGVGLASETSQAAVSTLTINLTYDTDATFMSAGLSATDIVNMKAASAYAASQFTNNFTDPINVNIFVTAVPGTSTFGKSSAPLTSDTFSDLRAKMVADAKTADDTTATGVGGSVPGADPVGGSHTWWVTRAQGKALGITADSGTTTTDGTFTFGGGFPYTYDPNNRAVAGKDDYIGISMHEFSEIMGRLSGMAITDFDKNGVPDYVQFDLFHYTGAGVRGLNNGPGRFFSIDNGTTLLKAFNDNSARGGDLQDWASGTNDSFNASSSSSVENDLTAVDLRVMDVIGYDFQSTAPPSPTPTPTPSQPNLTPYQPTGWSDKIVVSNTTGTSTDTASLKTTDTLYVDWAVLNNGTANVNATFNEKLYVDGAEKTTFTTNPPLNTNSYTYYQDYSIGSLSAGNHTIKIVADSGGVISENNESDNEYSKTITVTSLSQPNLTPYQPVAWSDKIVVSNVTGTSSDASSLKTTDTLYLDWAVINNGTADITTTFNEKLYVDGVEKATFTTNPPLNVSFYTYYQDYPIGSLSAGNHTVKIVADSGGVISESNEGDNEYSKTITVTSPTPTSNPIDQPDFFVKQHYLDFLNRTADQSGLDFWVGTITSCGSDTQCIDVKRINASAAFFISIEFQQTGYLVYRTYKAAYGNLTTPANAPVPIRFGEFLPDTQQIGSGVIVGQGSWQQQLEMNTVNFMVGFVQRSRFVTDYPTSMTPTNFVNQLFTRAGVTPSTSDRNAAIAEFGTATTTTDVNARAKALRDVAQNSILNQQEFNRAFVLMQYFGYLRRNPYDPPEATLDFQGYNFWLNKLNQFGGSYVNAEMVKSFILSSEYRQRFGP